MSTNSFHPQKSNYLHNFILQNKIDEYIDHSSDEFVSRVYTKAIWQQKSAFQKYPSFSFYTGMCLPFTYIDDGILECAGVTNYDIRSKTGTFVIESSKLHIKIENVHSYFVYAKLYGNDKYYVLDYKHVADIKELDDIYITASIKTEDDYKMCVLHNDKIVFEDNNIYSELNVDFNNSIGTYKERVSYVRYSKKELKNNFYNNYMYSIDELTCFQLDPSKAMPSVYLDLYKDYDWSRFKNQVFYEPNGISIFLHLNNSKTSQILREFINYADKIEQIKSAFEDDDTINLKVTYINRPLDVRFVYYCYLKDESVLGSAVMGIQLSELFKGTLNNPNEYIYISSKNNKTDICYCKKIVNELFNRCNEQIKAYRLPEQVINNFIDSHDMHVFLFQYLRDEQERLLDQQNGKLSLLDVSVPYFSQDQKNPLCDFSRENKIYEDIYQKLIMENKLTTKWISELTLFQMIKRTFNDAVYQYHCDWLGLQSLDVYIPSIKTGFEYQGMQHYEVVGIFGGIDGFNHRRHLDKKKKELCTKNSVRLIEWKYDEPISTVRLKEKLEE